jgi:hypothetical protein
VVFGQHIHLTLNLVILHSRIVWRPHQTYWFSGKIHICRAASGAMFNMNGYINTCGIFKFI